ncbi:DinB family protein [Aurantibacillus circumpalustris]|uniref:DinB family protein n=1 Tax=Aurantibacillus circumpalustris TaxID=3036359 RepID=UPI00295A9DCE|nr:DinB family protein [Aurantibacillus circumpalustris]
MRPVKGTCPSYYDYYNELVKENDLLAAFDSGWLEVQKVVSTISKEKESLAYAEGKWTIKQVIIHLIDTERIFTYRALRFARKDPQQVLSYDEDDYAAAAELDNRTLSDLIQEFETVRKASISLYKTFSEETMLRSGLTAIGSASVISLGYMTCGHALHHLNVIKERYLK